MNITLAAETEVTVVPAVTVTVTELVILSITDSPYSREIKAVVADASLAERDYAAIPITLWEGDDYDPFADFVWTASDVMSRVAELLGASLAAT